MANNELGKVRRSQAVMTYGPGAIIDFRVDNAPVSVVAAGLEQWDERAKPAGLHNPQKTFEYRLQRLLGVDGFRLPPVEPQREQWQESRYVPSLIGVRYPTWLQCPKCHKLKPAGNWAEDPGNPVLYCGPCSAAEGNRNVFVVPVRFIVACEHGHLDEFPWNMWVQHKDDCKGPELLLFSDGTSSGLSGLKLKCKTCGSMRSMDGCFGSDALKGLRCQGKRPWLASEPVQCPATPRVLQRGASNLYFPVVLSALDIPPWSDRMQREFGDHWARLCRIPDAATRIDRIQFLELHDKMGKTPEQINEIIETRSALLENATPENLKTDEYVQFTKPDFRSLDDDSEFEISEEEVPAELRHWVSRLVRATRLREVRAIRAFTRIKPPAGDTDTTRYCQIQTEPKNWLPAIEVRGEGIFVELDLAALAVWERQPEVQARAAQVNEAYRTDWFDRHGTPPPRTITPRLLLIHSFSHALIRQLALECGYSSASLRERLYVGHGSVEMAGLLIYTATPDSDGTLGGLVRQGRSGRFYSLVRNALQAMAWCSSDPLCIDSVQSLSEGLNLSACHSCQLLSETSCEEFNRLLDRAMLVGTPSSPGIGFFADFMRQDQE